MLVIVIRSILLILLGAIDRILSADPDSDWTCLHGREPNPLKREVYAPGYHWEVRQDGRGDIDILPLREDHLLATACPCKPQVDIKGARLIRTHNAFDYREIVEEAIRVMNEESE